MATSKMIRIERTYATSAEQVWRLWTTSDGIESWWAPDGFKCEVRKLDLRVGGDLVYALTATGPQQVEFMKGAGMPLTTEAQKTFTELLPGSAREPVLAAWRHGLHVFAACWRSCSPTSSCTGRGCPKPATV